MINTHKTSHARKHTHARTYMRTHEHTHTHTHTRLHYFQLLSVSLSMSPEVSFLSSQRPFHVPLGYPQKNGLKRCTTIKKNSQILFSLASFLLMSSRGCKRMSRDQIQKQPTVRASLGRYKEVPQIVCTCTKHRTHARTHTHTHIRTDTQTQNARARAHTLARAHTHTTHTTTLFPIALCLPLSATREAFKVPSTYRPGTFSILSETLSCTSRIPTNKGP